MTKQSPVPLRLAFVKADTPMFADLIEQLYSDTSLSDARRRDLISGLRRVAKALALPPEDVPCDSRWLQPRLTQVSPAALGLTPKSWQNAVSDARAALAHFGLVERRYNRIEDLSPDWHALWVIVLASGDKTLQPALCRFVHYLNRQGVKPATVRKKHAQAYRVALEQNEISKSPDVAYRAAVNGWNLAARRISQWPRVTLPLESRQKVIAFSVTAFPTPFQTALAELMHRLSKPDPLADDGQNRALRSATLAQYQRQLVRFASELGHSGIPICHIGGLDVLINPVTAERGLRQMLSRTNNLTTKMISEIAALLRNLARILNAPDDTRDALSGLAARLAVKPQNGMTQKNRSRLRVLQEDRHQQRLLLLPERIFARPRGTSKPYGWALAREDALAIAILLVCPVRVKNLAVSPESWLTFR